MKLAEAARQGTATDGQPGAPRSPSPEAARSPGPQGPARDEASPANAPPAVGQDGCHADEVLRVARPAAFLAGALACAIVAAGCTSGGSAPPGGSASSPATSRRDGPGTELHWHSCPAARPGAVCQPAGAAGLPPPGRPEDHPGAVAGAGHRAAPASSRATCWSTRAARAAAACRLAAFVADGPGPHGGRRVQHHRLRPARGRVPASPPCTATPRFFAGARPDYIPASAAAEQVLISRAKSYAADCEKRYGWLLPFMTTADMARDMDSIRAALGAAEDQLLRLLLRAPTWGRCTRRCSRTGCTGWSLDSTVEPAGRLVRRQHRPGLRVRGPDGGVLLLGRRAQRRLPARRHPRPRSTRPGTGPGPGSQAHPSSATARDRARTSSTTRSCWAATATRCGPAWPPRWPPTCTPARTGQHGQPVPAGGRAERERVRGLQRGGVQRRELAAELGEVGRRHQPGVPDGAVRGLGQRLVQRRLRVLAGARARPRRCRSGRRACRAS